MEVYNMKDKMAMQRIKDAAELCLFLLSDDASFITGENI